MAGGSLDNIANLRGMRYGDQSAELAQIQSARNALRLLDAAITRTELRLRALPKMVPNGAPGGGTGGGTTAGQRLGGRTAPRKMGLNKQLLPIKIDKGGMGLNPGFMKFGTKGATAALGFHIVAGLGNQIMETGDQMKAARMAGADMTEQAMIPVKNTARAAMNLLGVTSMAKMVMRNAFGEEEANRRVEDTLDRWFLPPSVQQQRKERKQAAVNTALKGVTKQWKDDLAFLDNWTPDDFDVYGDESRTALKDELWVKNRRYLLALSDLRADQAVDKAAQESGTD